MAQALPGRLGLVALAGWFSLLAGCSACERRPAPGPPAPPAPASSARLATIPAGAEVGETVFSADGRHVAFVATREGGTFVFHDARPGRPYQAATGLVLQPGTGALALVARLGGQEHVVVDEEEGPAWSAVGNPFFAPGGQVVHSGAREGRWFVVVGRRELAVAGSSDPEPAASADGKWIVFAEQRPDGGKRQLRACAIDLTGCLTGGSHDAISQLSPVRAAAEVAFIATRAEQESVATVTLGGPALVDRPAGWHDAVALFRASDKGGHLAYLAREGQREFLVKDGAQLPLPGTVTPLDLVVSEDGRVLLTAIVGGMGEGRVVALLDGKQVGPGREGIYAPTFSPDGSSWAFAAGGEAGNVVVVNGEEGPVFDKVVTPRFTPDGTRVVYRARSRGERFVVVADTRARTLREHPHYQAVFDVVVAPDGKSVGYGVRQGQEYWWKVEAL